MYRFQHLILAHQKYQYEPDRLRQVHKRHLAETKWILQSAEAMCRTAAR
jgi:hypothetical protein